MGSIGKMSLKFTTYSTDVEWEGAIVDVCLQSITEAVEKRGKAKVCLCGGSTPVPIYNRLNKLDINWKKCTFTLTDERWVNLTCSDSNERMVKASLLANVTTNFISLYLESDCIGDALSRISQKLEQHFSDGFDLVLLGMGDDGHIASLFPNTEETKTALSNDFNSILLSNQSPVNPRQRISLSPKTLVNSREIILIIKGKKKREMLQLAKRTNDPCHYPVSLLFNTDNVSVRIMWCDD